MFTLSSDVSPCLIVSKVWTTLDWCLKWIKCIRKSGPTQVCWSQAGIVPGNTHIHPLHNVHYCWWSTRLPPVCLVLIYPSKEWECWSTKEFAKSTSLDLHQCRKSFSNQDLKRGETKPHSKPYRPLSIVGEQFIEEQFIQQTHALCAFGSKWQRNCFPSCYTPLPSALLFESLDLWRMPVVYQETVLLHSKLKNSAYSPSCAVEMDGIDGVMHSCFSAP